LSLKREKQSAVPRIVLGEGAVEDALRAELPLHALRHVEDAALVLVGDVLPPQERVGVLAEHLLERRVQGLEERHRLGGRSVG